MALKKTKFEDNEEKIFDDAVIYTRGQYWQFRMWLTKERKYARFSLKTTNRNTAIDKAKLHYHELMANQLAGKSYFSITTKLGVEMYLEHRHKHIGKTIVKGRYSTIETHLEHWLDFIGRDVKLKELERTDCEDYFLKRTKTKKSISVSTTTIENEQSTINAMMKWLFKRNETYIDSFDFIKLKKKDKGLDENRRATFTDQEFNSVNEALKQYIVEAKKDLSNTSNLTQVVTAYYLGIAGSTGLRRGEQLQLRWSDVADTERSQSRNKKFDLIRITVRGETSKVGKTRVFVIKDPNYFYGLLQLQARRLGINAHPTALFKEMGDRFIFSVNDKNPITPRAIGYHLTNILKLAKIQGLETRDLVPYSFRHYFITQRVNSNLPPAAVAEMCGTSITQIEKTYYHTTEEKMLSNALADYDYIDGMLTPK